MRVSLAARNDSALAPTGTIQVVDITAPAGDLVAGATLPLAGLVQSRWQMDEHAGVLRVLSQAESTSESVPPVLETFRVRSASDVQRLAGIELAPPHPNAVLESVRFDGERAYAVTLERGNLEQSNLEQSEIEQGDALLAFDLSAPDSPRQVGELEVPGRVQHLEPRGDRLFAFGFDAEDEAAPIHVSLFDVSDLDAPALSSRVTFGGAFASLARSPERLDEAFAMLDDTGLILVSVAAGSPLDESCSLEYESGIQLVDFTRDTLTKRGVAPQVGSARRALIHREHLFGVGSNTVQTFDITDRDAPVATARLDVARNVSNARILGDHLLRFGNDWWTNQTTLEMTPLGRATEAQPQADIDLSALFGENAWGCTDETEWTGQAFTKGDYAYVPRISVGYSSPDEAEYRLALYVIDLRDRAAPKPVGSIEIEPFGAQTSFTGIIQTDSTLLVGRKVTSGSDYPYYRYPADPPRPNPRLYYDVIDLREPSVPELVHRLEVPEQLALGGFGHYHGLLGASVDLGSGWWHGDQSGSGGGALTDGDLVISQHFEHVEGWPYHARYFMDRLDVSNPREPVFLPKVNVPGNVVHFDADTGSIVTLDTRTSLEAATSGCSERGAWGGYVEEGRCVLLRRTLSSLVLGGERAVLQSQVALDESERTVGIAVSEQRLFYLTLPFANVQPLVTPTPTLHTLDLAEGSFAALPPVLLEPARDGYYDSPKLLRARGTRAFMSTPSRLDVVDTSDPSSPVQGAFALPAYTSCSALDVSAEAAYCALGQRGVEAFDLSTMR